MVAGQLLASPVYGQAGADDRISPATANSAATHLGYPQDWSSRHLVVPNVRAEDIAAEKPDPRLIYNLVRRQAAEREALAAGQKGSRIDWAVSTENGYVPASQFPAKYSFDLESEDCNADYVVFALNVTTSTFTQANFVGINNLYTAKTPAPCNGGAPWVAFAYNRRNPAARS
jgi:hypothetical protein